MKFHALSPGPSAGCPYWAVGMHSALALLDGLAQEVDERVADARVLDAGGGQQKSHPPYSARRPGPPRRVVAWAHDIGRRAVADLVAALPDGVVVTDADAMEKYRFDWSRDQSAGTPVAVVRAEDAGQVQTAVRWAAEHGVSVVPRGAGSGLSGGSTAVDGCLVLSLERMRAVEIDAATPGRDRASRAPSTPTSSARRPSTACGTRPTRRRSRSARSAATWRPTRAACAA